MNGISISRASIRCRRRAAAAVISACTIVSTATNAGETSAWCTVPEMRSATLADVLVRERLLPMGGRGLLSSSSVIGPGGMVLIITLWRLEDLDRWAGDVVHRCVDTVDPQTGRTVAAYCARPMVVDDEDAQCPTQ